MRHESIFHQENTPDALRKRSLSGLRRFFGRKAQLPTVDQLIPLAHKISKDHEPTGEALERIVKRIRQIKPKEFGDYLGLLQDPRNCPRFPGMYVEVVGKRPRKKTLEEFKEESRRGNIITIAGENWRGKVLGYAKLILPETPAIDSGVIISELVVRTEDQRGKVVSAGKSMVEKIFEACTAERYTTIYATFATRVPGWQDVQDFYLNRVGFKMSGTAINVKGKVHLGPGELLQGEYEPVNRERLEDVPSLTVYVDDVQTWSLREVVRENAIERERTRREQKTKKEYLL